MMGKSVSIFFLVAVVAVTLADGQDVDKDQKCFTGFIDWLKDSVSDQGEKLQMSEFSCSDPVVKAAAPGSKAEHWDAILVMLKPLYWDGGPQFPDGILFAEKMGGLPVPTGPAREYFTAGIQNVFHQLRDLTPNLCTKEGEEVFVQTLRDDYEKHKDELKEYAVTNCARLIEDVGSLEGARNVLATGVKAVIKALPEAVKYEPDERVLAALAEVVIEFAIDAVNE